MAQLTKANILTKYNDSGSGLFKDNTAGDIGADDARALVQDLEDSVPFTSDDEYSWAKGNRAGITAPASLKDIVTVGKSFGIQITFTDTTASNVLRTYELTNETTAESSPTVIRPNDYAGTTNEKVWRLRAVASTTAGVSAAEDVTFTPAGGISATDVQEAIEELDSEVDSRIAAAVAGLLDLRGTYDASVNAYPSSGGSGTAGAILKGDAWVISVAGTLPTGQAVSVGDLIFAIIDTPGTTQANWGRLEMNLVQATETAAGIAEIATQAETNTGSDDARIVTPLKLQGKVVGVQDLFVPAAAMWPRITGGCAPLAGTEMATSLVNIQALAFDQTTQEFAQFFVTPPRKWNNGTIVVMPQWTATTGSGTVQWGVSFGSYRNDDALTVALGTPQTSDDTLLATNDLHNGPDTSAITPAGTVQDSNLLVGQISRNPASDTLTGDALLIGVVLRFTMDAAIDA